MEDDMSLIGRLVEWIKRRTGYYESKALRCCNVEVVCGPETHPTIIDVLRMDNGLFTDIKRTHLNEEIARLRRNKKKISHLVAELTELESGK